ncbi:MAG: GNAT family N-acetyltransferase [Nitrospirae bacterium]|nr:GNAT family N-acetyltransferase [Nitrospirota bacterium]
MKYRWIENIGEYNDIAVMWDEALISSGNYNPFLLSDFIITWWRHFHNNLRLRIFVVYDDGKICGGLPLYIKNGEFRNGFAGVLHYIGGTAANYTEPFCIADSTKILTLLKDALSKRDDWDVLRLTDVRADNKLVEECRNCLPDNKFRFYMVQDHMNWAVDLSAGAENYFSTLSNKFKRDLRRRRKHAFKHYGELKLKEITGREEVERYFDIYTEFSLRAFNERNQGSIFENKKYSVFLRDLLVLMDQKQRLYAHVLFAGDKIMAVSFGYRFGKGFNWVLTSFNYEYKYVRPGYLLIEELVKEICSKGETYYNWYGHGQFYKAQWCNKQSPLFQFFLARQTLKGFYYITLQRIKIGAKSNNMLRNIVKKSRKIIYKTGL